ncbi:two-component system, NarL family, nitrate/nitrite response regulator NarL [Rhizobiales bacterium GAS191]|nr:two-component system, NarL family, nitrate/nitrite response regulator NarL [Rhizobiales bacterium GAS191]
MTQFPFATVVVHASRAHREGLVRSLGAAGFDVVAAVASVGEVALGLIPTDQSILLVLHGSGDQDAVDAQIQLFREHHPTVRIALLHDQGQPNNTNIIAAFRAGVDAYFVEPSPGTLVKGLELVMRGGTILSPSVLPSILHHFDEVIASGGRTRNEVAGEPERKYTWRLSKRHESILRCLLGGYPNKVIANILGLSETAVKIRVKNTLRKIGVRNRTQAAMWAMSNETLTGKLHEDEAARPAASAEPSPHGNVVPGQSKSPRDATTSPSDPSELAKRRPRQ